MNMAAVCVAFFALTATDRGLSAEARVAADGLGIAVLSRSADIDATADAAMAAVGYLSDNPRLMRVVEPACMEMAEDAVTAIGEAL